MTIAKSAFSGLSWTATSTLLKGGVLLVQLIILARILSPLELGLLALVNLTLGFAQIFADAGISNAIIYYKNLNKNQHDQLYLINVSLGLMISLALVLLAYPLAMFFNLPQLTELLILLSPIFLIRSLSQQQLALLRQKLKFDQIAKVEVSASLTGFILLLVLVWQGMGVESVVFSQLVVASMLSFLVLILNKSLLPNFQKVRWKSIVDPVKYGLYQTGEGFINYSSAQCDQLLIAKLLGPETLGIYSYVKELAFRPAMQVINPIVNRVTFPLMVKYKDNHSISGIYLNIIRFLTLLNLPLYLLIASYPEAVLNLVYGEDWLPQAELLSWMAIYMLLISFVNPIGSLLQATGEVKRGFWWNVLTTLIRPVLIILSISSGVVLLVKVLVAAQFFMFFLHWYFLIKPVIALPLTKLLKVIFIPCLAFSMVSLAMYLFDVIYSDSTSLQPLIIVSIGYLVLISPIVLNVIKFVRK